MRSTWTLEQRRVHVRALGPRARVARLELDRRRRSGLSSGVVLAVLYPGWENRLAVLKVLGVVAMLVRSCAGAFQSTGSKIPSPLGDGCSVHGLVCNSSSPGEEGKWLCSGRGLGGGM